MPEVSNSAAEVAPAKSSSEGRSKTGESAGEAQVGSSGGTVAGLLPVLRWRKKVSYLPRRSLSLSLWKLPLPLGWMLG